MEIITHDEKNLKLVERQINMGNELTIAAHGLTLGEKRIVMACIAQLDSRKWKRLVYDPNAFCVKLDAQEFADTYHIEPQTAYEQLKESCDRLMERVVKFHRKDKRTGKKIFVKYVWVQAAKYHEGEGWVEITFSNKVSEHLAGLTKNFTSYKLEQARALRSVYSWRLLEMFMQFKDTQWLKVSLDDFLFAMDVPDIYRTNFKHVRKRVIEHAINELVHKDNWSITWKAIKLGRKVVGLEFNFARNAQECLLLESDHHRKE